MRQVSSFAKVDPKHSHVDQSLPSLLHDPHPPPPPTPPLSQQELAETLFLITACLHCISWLEAIVLDDLYFPPVLKLPGVFLFQVVFTRGLQFP